MVDSSSARFHALDVEAALQRPPAYPPLSYPQPSFQAPLIPPPAPAASSFWTRSRLIQVAILATAILLPLLLTFISVDSSATVVYKGSRCDKCSQSGDCFLDRPLTCPSPSGGRSCCLEGGGLSTWECSVGGDSCHHPVLSSFMLVVIYVLEGFALLAAAVIAGLCVCIGHYCGIPTEDRRRVQS